jgi:hypothetical protein
VSVEIKLKGKWSPDNTDVDKAYSYFRDGNRICLQDNDYGLNRRWYPLKNVARVDDK